MTRGTLPLLLISSCVAFLAAQEEFRVQPRFEKKTALEPVLAKVDTAKDAWSTEQDYEQIQKQLKEIGASVKAGKDFPALADALRPFAKVELAELKIVSSDRLRESPPVNRSRVRYEIGGFASSGERISALGQMIVAWEQKPGGRWELKEALTSEPATQKLAKPLFTDVTAQVLGRNPSWKQQLAKGTDHWRTVLDEATGIGIYGHHGISSVDYNGDGWEDFYVCQPAGLPNRMFRNNGDGTFTDVSRETGTDVLDDTSMALFADFDRDGDPDMVLLTAAQPVLYVNDGRGRFEPKLQSGLTIPADKQGTLIHQTAADYDNDGDLDLYVCSHVFWTPGVTYTEPAPYYDANNGPPNFLFRNRGDGTFEDVTEASGLNQNNTRFSIAAAWADYDNDGDQDLYVANDYGRNNLYRNKGDGTFEDIAAWAGVEDMAAGMSVSWGDYDEDGWLDLYVSNMWSSAGQRVTYTSRFEQVATDADVRKSFQRHARGNTLFRNQGDGTFRDVTLEAGVEMGRWAWSSGFTDLDNDGSLDIYIANGYITGPDTHDL